MAYTGTFRFQSTDAGLGSLPLDNAAGTLTAILQAILVDGYNIHTTGVTIAQTAGTATLTKTGHGFIVGQIIRVSGFDQAGYNIDAKVLTVPTADTLTYAVNSGTTSPGTGTGAVKMCPLDWTPYANQGTNILGWQQPVGVGLWLVVDDTGTTDARFKGFTALTANPLATTSTPGMNDSNGSNAFPTNTNLTGGFFLRKSADGTDRAWICLSDRKTIIFQSNPATTTTRSTLIFGDYKSYKASETTQGICVGDHASLGFSSLIITAGSTNSVGRYCSHTSAGAAGSTGVNVLGSYSLTISNTFVPGGVGLATALGTFSSKQLVQRFMFAEAFGSDLRGHLPGMWFPYHIRPYAEFDTFTGATGSSLDGKKMLVLTATNNGQYYVEIKTGAYWD